MLQLEVLFNTHQIVLLQLNDPHLILDQTITPLILDVQVQLEVVPFVLLDLIVQDQQFREAALLEVVQVEVDLRVVLLGNKNNF